MIIGAQMYTLRDQCRTLPDLFEALKKVADIGYRSVQLSGVCSYEAEEMADMMAATGLTADLTHFDYRRIIGDPQGTAAFHDRFDCRYVGLGSTPYSATFDGLSRLVEELREPVQKLAAANHPLLYHNHDKEFVLFDREGKPGRRSEGAKTYLELLLEAFPKKEVGVTLDAYWAQLGGADPIALLHRLKGRVLCVHLKDLFYSSIDHAPRMAPVGEGNMNYEGFLEACLDEGVAYAFVEQDHCYGEDPFDCLRRSYENLRVLLGIPRP